MKRFLFLTLALLFAAGAALALPFDKYTLNRDDLPQPAREFLTTHFPKAAIGMIKIDRHLLKKADYDVKLVNGTKIEFNSKGAWTSVECAGRREVPAALIIRPIRNYVAKNFPGQKIVAIEKKAASFEIELADGVELKFDRLGNFKSVTSI